MLAITDVHKKLSSRTVLRGVSLEVSAARVCLLRGANGTGKSTLCEIVAGVLDPDRGEVIVEGRSIRDPEARRRIGYAPSNAVLPDTMLVADWVDCIGALRGATLNEIDAAIDRWSLSACIASRLGSLSLGQRRRLSLACAELGAPRLLLLDEPTVGLDDQARALLVARVRAHVSSGGAALVATHDLSDSVFDAPMTFTLDR